MPALPDAVRMVIFDLDGVVYRGDQAIPGASDLVRWLHRAGVTVRFATNNSMVARPGYVERLGMMGIETTADEIVTSTSATVSYLRLHEPQIASVLAVGAEGMRTELLAAGFRVTMAAEAVPQGYLGGALAARYDAVIVGLDPELDYQRLAAAMRAVSDGARLIATNADRRYPTSEGFLPGAGSIVAAVAAATEVIPEIIGKPEPAMFRSILEATGVAAGEAVVIGDNPDADVVGAHRAGISSILVLTGVADERQAAELRGERAPAAIARGPEVVRALLAERIGVPR